MTGPLRTDFKGKRVVGREFAGSADFNFQDLSGALFEDCRFSEAEFKNCVCGEDDPPTFKRCRGEEVRMFGARLPNARFESCSFPGIWIANSDFRGATFLECDFRNAAIREVDLSRCRFLHLNLENSRTRDIRLRRMPDVSVLDFARLWVNRSASKTGQIVYTSGAQRSPFIEYCDREQTKANLLLEAKDTDRGLRGYLRMVNRTIWPIFFGATTDFGHSIFRLIVAAATLVLALSLAVDSKLRAAHSFGDAVVYTTLIFISRSPEGVQIPRLLEIVTALSGFLMFSLLISIVSNKWLYSR
jgi:hypothetical protein